MSYQLISRVDESVHDCVEKPVWVNGIWECGNFRITDAAGDQYEVVEPTPILPSLEPLDFYNAFKVAERIAIKASTDPKVQEFWDTYERHERAGKRIDPNHPVVVDGLAYLATAATDGPGILASSDRIDQIRAGIPQ